MRRDRLGKGLGALLGEYLEPQPADAGIRHLKISDIKPNPLQPRRNFTDGELDELAASIKENGLLQPLVVRPAPTGQDGFELVVGERRFRAVSRLGWDEVSAVVRDASDETLLVLALVENLQREALNPLEEAEGYRTLAERFSLTQAEVAKAVGKDRSTVANFLRLLKLPPSVRRLLESGSLTQGHARALLSVTDPVRAAELARSAAHEGWSVRETERRCGSATKKKPGKAPAVDPLVRALEEALQEALSTRVHIRTSRKGRGIIEITFHGPDDFERVFELVAGKEASEVVG